MISNIIRNSIRKKEKEDISVAPYLEFKSSTPMTIAPNYDNPGVTLQYSLDKVTWTYISAKAVTPSASVIYFRGSAMGTKSLFAGFTSSNAWIFTGATNLEVKGDITMLLQGVLGNIIADIPLNDGAFSNMFYNCTSLVKAPSLPSTTLAGGCYADMFYGCTSLTTLPALPAITLSGFCYNGMFHGCTKIKLSTTKTGDYVNEYRVPTIGTGNALSSSLGNMFNVTGGTFASTPTINTTYYTENQVI